MGRLKKAKTGILIGHVDEYSTIALAQQLDDFKSSTAQGVRTTTRVMHLGGLDCSPCNPHRAPPASDTDQGRARLCARLLPQAWPCFQEHRVRTMCTAVHAATHTPWRRVGASRAVTVTRRTSKIINAIFDQPVHPEAQQALDTYLQVRACVLHVHVNTHTPQRFQPTFAELESASVGAISSDLSSTYGQDHASGHSKRSSQDVRVG